MKSIGIICEYNPFHFGHAYQLRYLRKQYPEAVLISVMSDAFVQRGEAAVLSPYARAEAAVRGGADLVLALPFPWSMAPAELFARGGIAILSAVGAEGLCFGTEGTALPVLEEALRHLSSPEFASAMQWACRQPEHAGTGYPALRGQIYRSLYGAEAETVLRQPNSMLGIEYLRACAELGVSITPLAVPRIGDAHDAAPQSAVVSASAVRVMLKQNRAEAVSYVPETTAEILRREKKEGRLFCCDDRAAALLLYHYRTQDSGTLARFAGLEGGLAGRLCAAAREASELSEFFSLAETKKYTRAAIRRAAWFGFFGVTAGEMREMPRVTAVLGANLRGTAWLRTHGKPEHLTVLTRMADGKRTPTPVRMAWERMLLARVTQEMLFASPRSYAECIRKGSPFLL